MYLERIAAYNGQSCRYPPGLLGDEVELVENSGQLNALARLHLRPARREAWGFDGYITSDCDADADGYNDHHYYKTPEETVAHWIVHLLGGTLPEDGARLAPTEALGELGLIFSVPVLLKHWPVFMAGVDGA